MLLANAGVVLAKGGRVVHDAGTVRGGDVIVRDYIMPALAGLFAGHSGAVEKGRVGPVHQGAAGELVQDYGLLAQHVFN